MKILTGIPRLARGDHRQSWEQNFRSLPDGKAQSTEIFRLIGHAGEVAGDAVLVDCFAEVARGRKKSFVSIPLRHSRF